MKIKWWRKSLDVAFIQLEGTVCVAPYIDVAVCCGSQKSATFKARIDTGADITVVPDHVMMELRGVKLGKPLLLNAFDGRKARQSTRMVDLEIAKGLLVQPKRGVICRNLAYGLLGMDVLKDFDITMSEKKMTLVYRGTK